MQNLVLVVDDDMDQRNIMRDILKLGGFNPVLAANGEEAIDFLTIADHLPKIIFLDMVMPIMDGTMFLSEINSGRHPALEMIPVIAVSAVIKCLNMERRYNCIAAIEKPCDFAYLLKVAKIFVKGIDDSAGGSQQAQGVNACDQFRD
jgi:CheY-like chemotaxis protein